MEFSSLLMYCSVHGEENYADTNDKTDFLKPSNIHYM